jgi:hypothetical protein
VSYHNAKVAAVTLFDDDQQLKELKKSNERFGYFHWIQLQFGNLLVKKGIERAKEEDEREEQQEGSLFTPDQQKKRKVLHFIPKSGKKARFVTPSPVRFMLEPECNIGDHKKVYFDGRKYPIRGHCRAWCGLKKTEWRVPEGKNSVVRFVKGTETKIPRVVMCCTECRVPLCKQSFENGSWDH